MNAKRWIGALTVVCSASLIQVTGSAPPAVAASSPPLIAFWDTTPGVFLLQAGDPGSEHLVAPGGAYPAWSPNGTELAYVNEDGSKGHAKTTFTIVVANREGLHPKNIISGPTAEGDGPKGISGPISWSPDGTEIAYGCDTVETDGPDREQLCVVDVRTHERRQITDSSAAHALSSDVYNSLSWSPDGKEIVADVQDPFDCQPDPPFPTRTYCAYSEIGIVSVKTGQVDVLTHQTALSPSFSPDGDHIVYYGPPQTRNGKPTGIVIMKSDGGGAHSIVSLPELTDNGQALSVLPSPTYAPNGKDILFGTFGMNSTRPGYTELFRIAASGEGDTVQLTNHSDNIYNAVATPTLTTCTVPKLKGTTIAKAKKLLHKAACTLGTVRGPKKHRSKRHIVKQSIKPNQDRPAGTRVNVVVK